MELNSEEQVNETLKRLRARKGVIGAMVLDYEGVVIVSTFSPEDSKSYAKSIVPLFPESQKTISAISPKDELKLLRVLTKKHEIMAVPGEKYVMVVLQQPGTDEQQNE